MALVEVCGQKLKKLSLNDRARILGDLKEKRRQHLIEHLKAAGVSGQEFFNEVDAFDQSEYGDWDFNKWLLSVEGRAVIISYAAKKTLGDDAQAFLDDLDIEPGQDTVIAGKLCNVVIKTQSADEGNLGEVAEEHKRPLVNAS